MPAFSKPTDTRSPLWRGRHNRLGFACQIAFVRGLGRWKSVILYGEIKIDTAKLRMRDPWSVFLHESCRYLEVTSPPPEGGGFDLRLKSPKDLASDAGDSLDRLSHSARRPLP